MPLRNAQPLTVRPRSVTDAIDGTNVSPPGSMKQMKDLVPSMHTRGLWVPRPAAIQAITFGGLISNSLWDQALWDVAEWDSGSTAFGQGELLQEVGNRVYGFITSSQFPGQSQPFVYDYDVPGFLDISGMTTENLPQSAPSTGDWTPPTMSINGAWTIFTHPGFSLPNAFGWLDETDFTDTATGDTGFAGEPAMWDVSLWDSKKSIWGGGGSPNAIAIFNLSKNVEQAGWRPGQLISDSAGRLAANTRIASISVDGLSITLSQPSIGPAVVGDTFTVQGGSKMFPLWSAGNTNINPLPGVATAVELFNGRTWYAVKNAALFSDAGDPLNRSFASQAVTLQNGLDITALATIPFNNATVIGGIVQALIVFQGDSGIWQITGDSSTSNLALNFLSPLGTDAPLTLATTPQGLLMVAPDGVRLVQLDGTVSPPIGANGDGIALPFVDVTFPSRMCAAYNEDVYRISVTGNTSMDGAVTGSTASAEYWYSIKLQAWSGPHSFPAKLITPTDRPATEHGFLMFPLAGASTPGGQVILNPDGSVKINPDGSVALTPATAGSAPGIWFSNTRPLINSTYIENGVQMTSVYETTLLPDTEAMFENMIVETTLMLGVPSTTSAVISAIDEAGNVIKIPSVPTVATVNIPGLSPPGPVIPPSLWDVGIWDQSDWDIGTGGALVLQRRVKWPGPLVFKQCTMRVTVPSSGAVAIGNLYLRYQRLGYMLQDIAA